MKKSVRPQRLKVGEQFEFIETDNPLDMGTWEVVRVSVASATCRKAGTVHRRIEVHNEWVRNPVTGVRYKRPLPEPKVVAGDFPDSRTVTISPHASVRRLA